MRIRPIEARDNVALATVIRNTLSEFGTAHPGTVYYDSTTDALFELFQKPQAVYYVVESGGQVMGGGGIYPTEGLPVDTCELVKMYLLPQARGKGIGKLLIEKCIDAAKEKGFKNIYLETMPELKQALKVYEKYGFVYLDKPLGNTGHFGCDLWMLKKL
jgi:putative acetyltransferase